MGREDSKSCHSVLISANQEESERGEVSLDLSKDSKSSGGQESRLRLKIEEQ